MASFVLHAEKNGGARRRRRVRGRAGARRARPGKVEEEERAEARRGKKQQLAAVGAFGFKFVTVILASPLLLPDHHRHRPSPRRESGLNEVP